MSHDSGQIQRVAVINGVRTPFVRARTVFQDLPSSALGGIVLREIVARSDIDPKLLEEIYFGTVSSPAEGSNVGREALFDSGLPTSIPCTTINRYCASSAEAAMGIAAKIACGMIEMGIAGGVESISSIRALFSQEATDFFQDFLKAKSTGQKLSQLRSFKPSYLTPHAPGIKEPTTGLTMGQSADLMAREFMISRESQDQFALDSHMKAQRAWERGFYSAHVVPVATPSGKVITKDSDIRSDSTLEKLSKLKPVFYKDGTITAGNSSPLTDGASGVLLMSEAKARELRLKPIGIIRSYHTTGVNLEKEPLLIGPAFAIPGALKKAAIQWKDIDLIEMHEAFAAQVLATISALGSAKWAADKMGLPAAVGEVDPNKLNVNGGSIPLGHPFGATGTRLILQAILELRARKKNIALVTACAAGGLGQAVVVEAVG